MNRETTKICSYHLVSLLDEKFLHIYEYPVGIKGLQVGKGPPYPSFVIQDNSVGGFSH